MNREAPTGKKRRGFRRWTWLIPAVLTLPVFAFLLSNLWLATPWSCHWIAGKIQNHTGLDTRVGGASWSPWNGISVQSIEILQPPVLRAVIKKPLASIATVKIAPAWRAWLHGHLEIRSITIDSPQIVLPIELLSHLSAHPQAPASPMPNAPTIPQIPAQPTPPSLPVAVPPVAQLPPNPATNPAPPPTAWLHLTNASIALVSANKSQSLVEISQINAALPIAGGPVQSRIKIGSITCSDKQLASNLSAPLDWKSPVLSLMPVSLEFSPFKILIAGKIAIVDGLPIQLEFQLPQQSLPETQLPLGCHVSADSIASNFAMRGLLAAPSTWQATLVAETHGPVIQLRGRTEKFDRGSAVTVLRGGQLSCVDARLISDNFSLLGNATLLADGRVAGVLRAVAPPASLIAVVPEIFPQIGTPSLTALSTPQRSAFDLEAFGDLGHLFLRLGENGPIVNLKPATPTP